MSFQPSHPQPFSPAEAAQLDVGTLVAEIARLRNSLVHLSSTQAALHEALAEEEDVDLRSALDENEAVIASQEERVEMLRVALVDKIGEDSLAHYGVDPPREGRGSANGEVSNGINTSGGVGGAGGTENGEGDEGMHL